MARNAIVNCTELVTYDLIKDTILKANLMAGERGEDGIGSPKNVCGEGRDGVPEGHILHPVSLGMSLLPL